MALRQRSRGYRRRSANLNAATDVALVVRERSYLSLNAVADGELPATAITGFGFHYQKERPVALVEHVQNLGLRPNPTRRKVRPYERYISSSCSYKYLDLCQTAV